MDAKSEYDYSGFSQMMEEWEQNNLVDKANHKSLFVFDPNTISEESFDSFNLSAFIKQNIMSYRQAGGSFSKPEDIRKIYGVNDSIYNEIEPYIDIPVRKIAEAKSDIKKMEESVYKGFFDPNSADLSTLLQFGFTKFQAENLIKYRESGGSLKNKNDLLKIYGIDSAFLESRYENIQFNPFTENEPVPMESVISIELNTADTTDLMKLTGVGSVFAQRIIKYRELLGGYYTKSQLMEVYNFPEQTFQSIEQSITVDTFSIKKIRINYAEFSDLTRHPYLDKNMANAILKHREKNGAFTTTEQIKLIPEIDETTFTRIMPYITCR